MSVATLTREPDLFHPDNIVDPYTQWEALRDLGPVVWVKPWNAWLVTGHAAARALLRRPDVGARDVRRQRSEWIDPALRPHLDDLLTMVEDQMIFTDPPDHTRIRRGLQVVFLPKLIDAMRPRIRALAHELIDSAAMDPLDWVRSVARPLPAIVVADMFGVPRDDLDRFVAWADRLVEFVGRRDSDEEWLLDTQRSMREWGDYFAEICEHNRGKDTILGRLLVAQEQENLTWAELVSNAIFMLTAGHETTTSLLGNGLVRLLQQPEQLARIRADRDLVPTAVEELLRIEPPLQMVGRVARADIPLAELGVADDAVMSDGDDVHVSIAAANRDPAVYDGAGRVDVTREPNRHVTFGFGIHTCLGASLARVEGQEVFNVLLDRFSSIEMVAPPDFLPNPRFRGLSGLSLNVVPA